MQAILALEDGRIFKGDGYGAQGECRGEVVFNTSLTGYQEIFTDPSYAGQIVVLTNPQIGNYGTNSADNEAAKPYIEGLVTREFSPISSNWRSQQVADEYLERWKSRSSRKSTPARWSAICATTASCAASSPRWKPTPTFSSQRPAPSAKWTAPIWPASSPPKIATSSSTTAAIR